MHRQAKRQKYSKFDSSNLRHSLEPGTKGFLCTFNNREKECIRESYNILNKFADQLYGSDSIDPQEPSESHMKREPPESNIEDDLEKELNELKTQSKDVKKRRFQVVKSGAKNVLFVRTTIDDPVALASMIVNEIKVTKQLQTRFLIRLVPIEITCKAYANEIKKACSTLLEKHFKNNNKSFSIVYNRRNNGHLDRDEVIKEVADLLVQVPGDHVVDLKNADVTIIIEVIKSVALLAVVPNYAQMRKFNLHGFVDDEVRNTNNAEGTKENEEHVLKKGDDLAKEGGEEALEGDAEKLRQHEEKKIETDM